MKKLIIYSICCFLICLSFAHCSNNSKIDKLSLSITSHTNQQSVNRPLPLKMSGKINNYSKLSEKQKKNIHVYLIEQSVKEKIWHIEPKVEIADNGTWIGYTWLGNKWQGKWDIFNVCVFVSKSELQLNDGDHPVKEKPEHIGESCIKLKRRY